MHAQLSEGGRNLFTLLGYTSQRTLSLGDSSPATFAAAFDHTGRLAQRAMLAQWRSIDLLFQIGADDLRTALSGQQSLFAAEQQFDQQLYGSFLFFAVELTAKADQRAYTRSELATITRELNRLFVMPTSVLFRFPQPDELSATMQPRLTLAIVTHRPNLRDQSRDVLEKVSLIHAIRPENPHRAHLDILADLALAQLRTAFPLAGFDDLQKAWARVLDIRELNKRFYKEIADWYFWAVSTVTFPEGAGARADLRNATSMIRLLTRLIFVWFLKEKGLVPEALFRKADLEHMLHALEPDQSSFYKAILQNLFFATLNTPMDGKRAFRAPSKSSRPNPHYGVASVLRYEALFRDAAQALTLFQDIPFLNGGLFECLDSDQDHHPQFLVDGFSDRADNPLLVPNRLFFGGPEQPVDLNRIYGSRGRSFRVRGLLDILDDYKFTIAENTPVEEEVALDPELLGQVFENLLAAYNPETETTARKETGSFYTPRTVVEYMVDESLLLLFQEQLQGAARINTGIQLHNLNERLRDLLSYSRKAATELFSPTEMTHLITRIDTLKLIDPACGSGAFPMGALQKLVYILSKLDPGNRRWRERQLERAEQIPDIEAREAALEAIQAAFERNELDYGRKLYLLENAIYGVDIQPIAVQIAKLRCFIALIVDQRVDRSNPENYGIRALPNLETRFVAADSLNGVRQVGEQGVQMVFRDAEVDRLERQLSDIRSRYFSARNRRKKQEYRERDTELRGKLADQLQALGWDDSATGMLAHWNPYSQNDTAPFFDAEWMFGLTNGFDLVIANPPYVRQEQIDKDAKERFKKQYSVQTGTADLYVYFYERGIQLLADGGVLTFISSNKYFRAGYGQKLRRLLAEKMTIEQIIDFGDAPVFTAIAYPSIIVARKGPHPLPPSPIAIGEGEIEQTKAVLPSPVHARVAGGEGHSLLALNWNPSARVADFPDIIASARQAISEQAPGAPLILQKSLTADGWRLEGAATQRLLEKLKRAGMPLGDYVKGRFYRGILTGFNEAFVVDRATRDRLIAEHGSSEQILKPFLRGRDVKRWRVESQDLWLLFVPWHFPLQNDPSIKGASEKAERAFAAQYPAIYEHLYSFKSGLVARNKDETGIRYEWYALQRWGSEYWQEFEQPKIFIPAITNKADYARDIHGYFGNDKTSICVTQQSEFICALLNSAVLWWYIRQLSATKQGGFFELKPMYVTQLPIVFTSHPAAIEQLVEQILAAKASNPRADVSAWEREIDERVYALYGLRAEEIRMIEESQAGVL